MANDNPTTPQQPPQPNPDLKGLDRLVGTWDVSGGAQGQVTYEWLDSGFFLLQHVELEQYGQTTKGVEIIGQIASFFPHIRRGMVLTLLVGDAGCSRAASSDRAVGEAADRGHRHPFPPRRAWTISARANRCRWAARSPSSSESVIWSSGHQHPDRSSPGPPTVISRLPDLQVLGDLRHVLASASSRSASRSLRTICSGVWRRRFMESSCPSGRSDSHTSWDQSHGGQANPMEQQFLALHARLANGHEM
jgi:hypothetical protein